MNRHGDGARCALRAATYRDASVAAELYLSAREAAVPAIPPLVHDGDEVRRWFRDVVVAQRETWLAEQDDRLVAIMVLDGQVVDQLYVHPERTGRGVGSELVRLAQSLRPDGLSLWTFQSNHAAQRFYVRHGFVAAEHTDGHDNEERAPDVRYVWSPHRTSSTIVIQN